MLSTQAREYERSLIRSQFHEWPKHSASTLTRKLEGSKMEWIKTFCRITWMIWLSKVSARRWCIGQDKQQGCSLSSLLRQHHVLPTSPCLSPRHTGPIGAPSQLYQKLKEPNGLRSPTDLSWSSPTVSLRESCLPFSESFWKEGLGRKSGIMSVE